MRAEARAARERAASSGESMAAETWVYLAGCNGSGVSARRPLACPCGGEFLWLVKMPARGGWIATVVINKRRVDLARLGGGGAGGH